MTRLIFLSSILVLIYTVGSSLNLAFADNSDDSVCDISRDVEVNWPGITEHGIVRTVMTGGGDQYPSATYTLIMADGQEVDLGGGGKFIDDWSKADGAPSCWRQMEASGVGLASKSSFDPDTESDEVLHLSDMLDGVNIEEFLVDEPCAEVNQAYSEFRQRPRPDRADKVASDFYSSEGRRIYNDAQACERHVLVVRPFRNEPERLKRLLLEDPPIVEAIGSTYFVDFMVYDREEAEFISIGFSGC